MDRGLEPVISAWLDIKKKEGRREEGREGGGREGGKED